MGLNLEYLLGIKGKYLSALRLADDNQYSELIKFARS
jgi:hypothetical protein